MTEAERADRPRLNIAMLAPIVSPIGPPFLGGTQVVIHDLTLALARRGHTVRLFAATGSALELLSEEDRTAAKNIELVEVSVRPGELVPADFGTPGGHTAADAGFFRQGELFLQTFLKVNRARPAFEIAHSHAFDWPAFAFSPLSPVPTVHTLHLPSVDPRINAILATTYRQTGFSNAITISKACAATYGNEFGFDRVIYNAINTASIPFGATGEDFLLYAGRMSPEKGPDLAIEIARQAGRRLVLVGGIYNADFFEAKIAPEVANDPNLEYLGQRSREEVYQLMSRAYGVLFPSRWEEPFGLVIAESLAAGAPVVSWQRGAAPEIISEGRTGYLIPFGDVAAAVAAVNKLGQLDRAECRRYIETNFSVENIIDQYEDYYYAVIRRSSTG